MAAGRTTETRSGPAPSESGTLFDPASLSGTASSGETTVPLMAIVETPGSVWRRRVSGGSEAPGATSASVTQRPEPAGHVQPLPEPVVAVLIASSMRAVAVA